MVNLEEIPGQVTQIVGASGSGLTRLAHQWYQSPPQQWAEAGEVALVLQEASAHISGLRATVYEELVFPLEQRGLAPSLMREKVNQMLQTIGLTTYAQHHPAQLSGGQTRRLALGVTMITEPGTLIVDNAFAGLDTDSRHTLATALRELANQGTGVVVLGHSVNADLGGVVVYHGDSQETPVVLPAKIEPTSSYVLLSGVHAIRGVNRKPRWRLGRRVNNNPSVFQVGPVDLRVPRGGVLWLRGDNGSGKTSLLRAAAGVDQASRVSAAEPSPTVSLAVQHAADQVVEPTVAAMLQSGSGAGLCAGPASGVARGLGVDPQAHPLDLSQSDLRIIQVVAAARRHADVLALDEPDVGVDRAGRNTLHRIIAAELAAHRAVVMTCHDESFFAEVAEYAQVKEQWLPGVSGS
ncbi:ATP-binding cassette domain-containing protein [Corynebacterium poyangense]|uniref:ATP-binding cassette domain-containing protein n=1 Tax=Corynebacterium poyangense TaxID=2684405 RepID=A0A7H0SLH4_9CORY|nr:ATP-binding cassette domain-containing protein [Corynebacterium poyangense]QNQ89399.1 ATP-binding cassette domain-containing protein [Corynebacterium poyangense]